MWDESDQENAAEPPLTGKHPPVVTIEDVISFRIARFTALIERLGQGWVQDLFDLSLNQWRVLALIRAKAPVHAGDISDFLLMDKSQLSRLLKQLAGRQLVSSKPDPNDARAVVLKLTNKGKTLYAEALAEVVRRNERTLTPLSRDEVLVFDEMLGRLVWYNQSLVDALESGAKSA